MSQKNTLTEKQRLFCEYYLTDEYCFNNVYRSALKAGYSESYAKCKAGKMLKMEQIQKYMDKMRKKIDKSGDIPIADELYGFWGRVMYNDEETTKNRLDASKLLAQAYGLFTQKLETKVEGKLEGKISGEINNPMEGLTAEELRKLIELDSHEGDTNDE